MAEYQGSGSEVSQDLFDRNEELWLCSHWTRADTSFGLLCGDTSVGCDSIVECSCLGCHCYMGVYKDAQLKKQLKKKIYSVMKFYLFCVLLFILF